MLRQVLGYQLAQAAIITFGVFNPVVRVALDLRPVEYTILMLIRENPGISPAKLATWLAVTRPNVSLFVDKLEGRGLARRERNANDGRSQHLHVTDKGAALAANATRQLIEGERGACAALTVVEQLMLTELLQKLNRSRRAAIQPLRPSD
jgi:DNA-binding MarR family transcriptional regulator